MVKRKTCVFQRKLTEEEETEGGRVRWCELDEEKKAEAGEVEKEEGEKYQCEHCGKSYVF